jgi:dihydroorotate dehydrogenase electron transfer subunit
MMDAGDSTSMSGSTIDTAGERPPIAQVMARIIDNRPITPDSRVVTLDVGDALPESLPGQFVHLRLGDGVEPFLRRPFSILGQWHDNDGGRLSIMYAVVGAGTRRLAAAGPGTRLDLLGPLGNGFLPAGYATWILVAGGRGAAPLFRLLEVAGDRGAAATSGPQLRFLFGARSREQLWGLERLDGVPHRLATDDGSHGHHGTVIDLVHDVLVERPSAPVVLACGPEAMLAAVASEAAYHGVPAQVSLESIMGCACGLCRGCVIPRRLTGASPWPRDGNQRYATVCKEGPVFLGSEVDWAAMPHA